MTTYGEYLSQLIASSKAAHDYIPRMCAALRKEDPHLSNEDIRDRVTKDCLEAGLAKSTIIHNIPEEFKNPDKIKAGKSGAEKKKIIVTKTTSGAAATEAENKPESANKSNSRRLEIRIDEAATKESDENNALQPKDEDVGFLKKQLNKRIEENLLIERLQQEKVQLSEAVKKNSFTKATNYKPDPPKKFEFPEPDESNTFVWKNITFDELRMKLGPLKASSNTKINVYLERVVL